MARAPGNKPIMTDANLNILEGKLQEMRQEGYTLPKMLPVDWLASQLCVKRQTIQAWVSRGRNPKLSAYREQLEHFVELYDAFVVLFASKLIENAHTIALSPSNPQALASIKMLLPRVDPSTWSDTQTPEERPDYGVAEMSREDLDELNEDELLELEKNQLEIERIREASALVVRRAQARRAQRAAAEPVEH